MRLRLGLGLRMNLFDHNVLRLEIFMRENSAVVRVMGSQSFSGLTGRIASTLFGVFSSVSHSSFRSGLQRGQ